MLSSLFYDVPNELQLKDYLLITKRLSEICDKDTRNELHFLNNRIESVLDKDLNQIAVEYSKLFLLPNGVVPYASCYLDGKKLLKQESWEQVKDFYMKLGWKIDEDENYLADHISVELAFMAKLVEECDKKVQNQFFNSFLITWLPSLFQDIKNKEISYFYYAVACFGDAFIKKEQNRIWDGGVKNG
ncbi:TorD/DmsD family molecular chaperone [Natranaerobius trueperi]|uniref:TorD/DmsD family molecular chaperone n=1 Tax=Natranaerobius trueperi TaxID=759412 RepID=UPI001303C9D2|nr:molecular chaperone TorD family protein [Natranaerobius trueperi]